MKTIKFLLLSFLIIAGIQSVRAQKWMTADVNKDKTLSHEDIIAVINSMAGDITYIATADVNNDGKIDVADLVAQINIIKAEDPAVAYGICPDRYHPHVVDMGAAGKWACCDLGASLPWEKGAQCAWGDPKMHYPSEWAHDWDAYPFTWQHYPHRDEKSDYGWKDIGDDIAQTENDVATVNWGTTWCMPNDDQMHALLDLPYEWTMIDGVYVRKVKASNGNVLYLWADDFIDYYTSEHKTERLWGYYNDYGKWIEDWYEETGYVYYSIAHFYDPSQTTITDYSYNKQRGQIPWFSKYVRPIVCTPKTLPDEAVLNHYCPDSNHPHLIDLGDGGKWACCNVGASAPWETGGYYSWGGTKQLSFYGATPENETATVWGTNDEGVEVWGYKWGMWNDRAELLPAYDVARTAWGGQWHMPTMEYFERLNRSAVTKTADRLNGTPGLRITSSNGRKIFIPYCGRKVESDFLYDKYNALEYWTATSVNAFQGMILEPNAAASHHNYWYDPIDGESPEDSNTDFVQVHQARGVGLPVRAVQ